MSQGIFFTLEGLEGVGKTTHLHFIADYFRKKGRDFIETREPGGTPLAEAIRDLTLDPDCEAPTSDTELLLMFASRAQHLHQVVYPALEAGKDVLCSRFTHSTFAYQGGGRQLSSERIQGLADWVHPNFGPDLTILLDLEPSIGLERAVARGKLDRIEKEKLAFFNRVRASYLEMAKNTPTMYVVNADQSIEAVQADIHQVLDQYM